MPTTPRPTTARFDVSNLDQWGRLIKSWATGLDYVTQAAAPQPPRDYWVNPALPGNPPPAPATVQAAGQPWNLPPLAPVSVPAVAGGAVPLPSAVALTVADFIKLVTEAGVCIKSMPVQYKNVIIVQGDIDTMILRLPPKDTLQGSEDDLLNNNPYQLRAFYWALFGGAPNVPELNDQAGIMELHANRIGEYTLNNCS